MVLYAHIHGMLRPDGLPAVVLPSNTNFIQSILQDACPSNTVFDLNLQRIPDVHEPIAEFIRNQRESLRTLRIGYYIDATSPMPDAVRSCTRLESLMFKSAPLPFEAWRGLNFLHTVRGVVIDRLFGSHLSFRALADALPNLRTLEADVFGGATWDGFEELALRLRRLQMIGTGDVPVEAPDQCIYSHPSPTVQIEDLTWGRMERLHPILYGATVTRLCATRGAIFQLLRHAPDALTRARYVEVTDSAYTSNDVSHDDDGLRLLRAAPLLRTYCGPLIPLREPSVPFLQLRRLHTLQP
jgi:hypothetical protein